MAIRFKFRSSVNFDSMDINGQNSISARDLKAKIIHHKNLISKDFDLVFFDAITGQEYGDETFQIPSGSSIIIKRVPAGSAPSEKVAIDLFGNFGPKDDACVKTMMHVPANADENDFDDFGVDLCPEPEGISFDFAETDEVNGVANENTKIDLSRFRCSEPLILRCQKLETSDLGEAVPEGPSHVKSEGKELLKTDVLEDMEFEQVENKKFTAIQSTDFPSELRCPLCNDYYKEAVMIPCCQHSFCKKCIYLVLVEKRRCPKCFSTKCRVEDLLPNVSLCQAIDHFLGSQISAGGPDVAFDRFAPDGESGIQMKDVSCAVIVHKKKPDLPHSSSATGRGSNQINVESTDQSIAQNDPSVADSNFVSCLGAVDSTTNVKTGPWMLASGGSRSFAANDRDRKGGRSCYTCGSRDHLMRDCPAASGPFSRLPMGAVTNYLPACWNGAMLSHAGSFQHMYGNPGVFPFNSAMMPAPPFAVPTHMPPMYGGVSIPSALTGMGALRPPIRTIDEYASGHSELSELQERNRSHKGLRENLLRGQQPCDEEAVGFTKQHETKRPDLHNPRPQRKQHHGDHSGDNIHHSVVEERYEKASSSRRHGEDRHKSHHTGCSKKTDPRKAGSDSSHSRDHIKTEKHINKMERSGSRRHRDRHHDSHSNSGSGFDPAKPPKDSKQLVKRDRWQMTCGSDEDGRDNYHRQKQKRAR